MNFKRYGKFHFFDHYELWIVCLVAFTFLAAAVWGMKDFSPTLKVLIPILWIPNPLDISISYIRQYREKFLIAEGRLYYNEKKTIRKVMLPAELTLVISQADLWQGHGLIKDVCRLKGQYCVSLLQNLPTVSVINELHEKCTAFPFWQQYAPYGMSTIRKCYGKGFIYNFVCDQEKLDLLLQTSKCHLIIPEEIYEKHPFDLNGAEVYVDRSMPVGANRTARQKAIPNGHDGSITRILFDLFLILGGFVFLFMF